MPVPEPLQSLDNYRIKPLMERRNLPGVVKILQFLLLISITGYLLSRSEQPALQFFLTLALGLLLTFLFAPLHESIHKTAFVSPWLNRIVGMICGFVLFLPPKSFRAFHMAHHRYTQTGGKDPELDMKKPATMGQYLWLLSGFPYWTGQVKSLLLFTLGKHKVHYVKDDRYAGIVKEARVYSTIYIALIPISIGLETAVFWEYWILPVLLGQPFLRAFLLAEHVLCPQVENMFQNTRTTLTSAPVRWLCWDMCFHTEHHAFPGIPFHQLGRAHSLLKPHMGKISKGYISVHREVLRSF